MLVTDCVTPFDSSRKIRKGHEIQVVAVCFIQMWCYSLAVTKEISKSCQNIRYCKRCSNPHPSRQKFHDATSSCSNPSALGRSSKTKTEKIRRRERNRSRSKRGNTNKQRTDRQREIYEELQNMICCQFWCSQMEIMVL
jgi:hypothetical protein